MRCLRADLASYRPEDHFERFRRGGKLHTALGAALESALSDGILERLPDGRVGACS